MIAATPRRPSTTWPGKFLQSCRAVKCTCVCHSIFFGCCPCKGCQPVCSPLAHHLFAFVVPTVRCFARCGKLTLISWKHSNIGHLAHRLGCGYVCFTEGYLCRISVLLLLDVSVGGRIERGRSRLNASPHTHAIVWTPFLVYSTRTLTSFGSQARTGLSRRLPWQ